MGGPTEKTDGVDISVAVEFNQGFKTVVTLSACYMHSSGIPKSQQDGIVGTA